MENNTQELSKQEKNNGVALTGSKFYRLTVMKLILYWQRNNLQK